MKKYSFLAYIGLASLLLTSCIKEDIKSFQGDPVIEFDATVFNSVTAGYTYPILIRAAGFGRAVSTALDPSITRTSATVKLRVNLVGAQRSTDEVFTYRIITEAVSVAPNALAVLGTHFSISNTFTIPANTSFGEVIITVLNTGVSSTTPREVHLELEGNGKVGASANYKKVAIRIAQN
ncbi:MAG: hypothetical protein SGI83_09625 [Bacteroidota bacterium]|nr:hypothetical protein [Bacteroidota bacterium]